MLFLGTRKTYFKTQKVHRYRSSHYQKLELMFLAFKIYFLSFNKSYNNNQAWLFQNS
jgi:hypothetical protein